MQPSDEILNIIREIHTTISSNLYNIILNFPNNNKLVHYTSAIVAREIIEKEQLWLRKTIFMNDYSEITYGKQCLDNLLNDPEIIIKLNNILTPFGKNLNDLKKSYYSMINDVEKKNIHFLLI